MTGCCREDCTPRGGEAEDRSETTAGVSHPEDSRRQEFKRQRLAQPKLHSIAEEHPWSALDRKFADVLPKFCEPMWTLGDTARWVIERTPEAVNGLSIDENKLLSILPEIRKALADGEVSAFAHTQQNPVPIELPAEAWFVHELVVEEKNGLIRIFPANSSSNDCEQHLFGLMLKSGDVLRRWPSSSKTQTPVQQTKVGAENQCRRWLAAMMKEAPNQPRPKLDVREKAQKSFPGLANRAFDRAWHAAIRESRAEKWRAPGRRS